MIKSNELRIGNWVSNGDFNYTVDVNSLWDAATLEYYPIEGIALTPEILEKAGFKNQTSIMVALQEPIWKKSFIELFIVGGDENQFTAAIVGKFIPLVIKSLHQLQNLYFALTGDELKINLNNK